MGFASKSSLLPVSYPRYARAICFAHVFMHIENKKKKKLDHKDKTGVHADTKAQLTSHYYTIND